MTKIIKFVFASALFFFPVSLTSHALATSDLVAERKAKFRQSGGAMRAMRGQIQSGDFAAIAASAAFMAEWAEKMPDYFPEGSGPDNHRTSAKPAIWAQFDKFTALANQHGKKAIALQRAADSQDAGAVMSAMQELGKSCGACHSQFKE
ncbi:MAG: c-type cytochrome [Candidatus Puniceispirillaceae bacterium]